MQHDMNRNAFPIAEKPCAKSSIAATAAVLAAALVVLLALICAQPAHAFAEEVGTTEGPAITTGTIASTVELPPIIFGSDELKANAGLPDADRLFSGYVEQLFAPNDNAFSSLLSLKVTRGSRLTGQEKAVYDKFSEHIRDIAAGRKSDTILAIPLTDLGVQQYYTAEALGLETIFDPDNPAEVSEEARLALNAQFQVSLSRVLNAVICDFPYELYWYDKTIGTAFQPPSVSSFDNGEGGALVFARPYEAYFKMYVSADYSQSGYLHTFVTDTEKTGAASAAAQRAHDIVDAHADESDYDKLHSYLEEVAKLTDYDYDAVIRYEETGAYGDPWQVIHVFDGIPDTKVVCEGYAKAFQYLCDASTFENDTISCNSISGYMHGGTGAGPHLWNIVSVDGNNYLVDVTNNDNYLDDPTTSPTSTTPHDELFMAGATGSVYEGYLVEWPKDASSESATPEDESNDAASASDDTHWLYYEYDEDALYYFDENELALSATPYRPTGQGESSGSGESGGNPGDSSESGGESGSQSGSGSSTSGGSNSGTSTGTGAGTGTTGGSGSSGSSSTSGSGSSASGSSASKPSTSSTAAAAKAKQNAIDKTKAKRIRTAISNLPATSIITDASAKKVSSVRKRFNALSAKQKKLVGASARKKLVAAEKAVKTTITISTARITAATISKACKKAGKKTSTICKVVLGKNVKAISARAFKNLSKTTKLVLRTKKLSKKSTAKCLVGSKVKVVSINLGSTKANKTYIKEYRPFFAKANSGKAVKVS